MMTHARDGRQPATGVTASRPAMSLARIELGDRAARMLAEEHRAPLAAVRWRAAVAHLAARRQSLTDDIDGSPADGLIVFSIDGADYEITLSAVHEQALRQMLGPYVDAARRVRHRSSRPGRRPAATREKGTRHAHA